MQHLAEYLCSTQEAKRLNILLLSAAAATFTVQNHGRRQLPRSLEDTCSAIAGRLCISICVRVCVCGCGRVCVCLYVQSLLAIPPPSRAKPELNRHRKGGG